ncbi:hypothetical protein [Henriciella algicola]|jgi:hypothetical protein|uniref:Uncharacterized protein n=1 Tax=Henriciella algicola TaxID=1608422 RepID=A0A399RE08_9PROT|nr:hypothetical protein [Henriciella algicola]RIJ29760.1 hypothetical protein D1222_08325 [Henriciella algicola]|tara:strand:- start:282 stop:554 length:273 start_codon:yes stop_codon:yes gene_type:complete
MKFFIINSFRAMVYIAYLAIIACGVLLGIYQHGQFAAGYGLTGDIARVAEIVGFTIAGWIVASVICGLIVAVLDIRDDINDRLPDARRDS